VTDDDDDNDDDNDEVDMMIKHKQQMKQNRQCSVT